MIVQINEDLIFVDKLKDHTGLSTASKAFKFAARKYLDQVEQIDDLTNQLSIAKGEAIFYKNLINQARNAATLLLDQTAQQDLLS